MARLLLLLATVAATGCFSPRFQDGRTPCTVDGDCPPGFQCAADRTCWRQGTGPAFDLSGPGDMSLSPSPDMATPPDLAMLDMTQVMPQSYPPATTWPSCGGGSGTGNTTSARLNLTIGGTIVIGRGTAASGSTVTFGYFSDDIY